MRHAVLCGFGFIIALGERPARAEEVEPPPVVDDSAAPEVIEIRDELPDAADTRIATQEAKQIPGSLGDPVRAIMALPGTAPTDLNSPYFYVRGAPPGNTGYMIDGIQVPLLFHVGAVTSVIQGALVDAIDLYASAPPARFGGVAGGVIALEPRPPARAFRAEAEAKLYEASLFAESPFAGGRGSLQGAFRIGYPRLITSLLSSDVEVDYRDYQARSTWQLGARDRLTAFAFGSHDRVVDTSDNTRVEDFKSDFYRVDLSLDHDHGAGHVRAGVTTGWSSQGAESVHAHARMLGARLAADVRLGSIKLRGGAELTRDAYTLSGSATTSDAAMSPASAAPPPTNLTGAVHADAVWQLTHALQITPGLRAGFYRSERSAASASATVPVAEPRLAVRLQLRPGVTWLSSAAIMHQYPSLRVGNAPAIALTVPGFPAGDTRLQTSQQVSGGLELLLPAGFAATTTLFGSRTQGLSDLPSTCQDSILEQPGQPIQIMTECADERSDGTAYGLELSLRRSLHRRLAGWLSYTLSRSTERYGEGSAAYTVSSPYDRRHVASASVAYGLTARWRAGARLMFYSSAPTLTVLEGKRVAADNGTVLPPLFRVDLRVERQWRLPHNGSMRLVFDVLNASLSKEYTAECGPPEFAPGRCGARAKPMFVVPSIGLEGSL